MLRALLAYVTLSVCALCAAPIGAADLTAPPYKIVRLTAEGIDAKSAVIWRVHPNKDVSRATSPRGVLEFVAPPGEYLVECLIIKVLPDGGLDVEERSATVEILPPAPANPPPKKDPPNPHSKADPVNALGRIQFGNAGCTATVIGPRRADGRWDILTAAHCIEGKGQRGRMVMKGGAQLNLTVLAVDKTADCAWCVCDESADLPFATIASKNPDIGVKIWHMGYGIDQPGNREAGEITGAQNDEGQLKMWLSVSSGDSGGGIFREDTGELIACVCCTTQKGAPAHVWGCAAEVALKLRPTAARNDEWKPMEIPVVARKPCVTHPLLLLIPGGR